ncbi:MAG: hypothetical protein KGZ67_06610 [Hydrogenophaga sp.]|nr:hypothetical protein [Hydrogenophaga sp.]
MEPSAFEPGDESYTLPSAEALIAGTLALMTGYAQTDALCTRRVLLARKLVCNLGSLAQHPQMSAPMQSVLSRLQSHWLTEIDRTGGGTREATPLWHPVAAGLQ